MAKQSKEIIEERKIVKETKYCEVYKAVPNAFQDEKIDRVLYCK